MAGGRNILFPRDAVPADIGATIRRERKLRKWSQERLALKAGVERRTILRLEAGRHVPGSALVHAMERALGLEPRTLTPGWREAARENAPGAWGPRARLARQRRGLTIAAVASASGVSAATISRFEREMGDTPLILSDWETGEIGNVRYAVALGFAGRSQMTAFLWAAYPAAWLKREFAPVGRCPERHQVR